jgi:hypothetical protein
MTGKKNDILQEIVREEARLRELDQTREEARARIASLRPEFDGISAFRARTDVFPTRFESKKTSRAPETYPARCVAVGGFRETDVDWRNVPKWL